VTTKQDILQKCRVDGSTVFLPDIQLDRKLYCDVAKALGLIGGKWNRKTRGFVFSGDPSDLLAAVASGEQRSLKKEYQFFATPDGLADRMVELLDVEYGHSVLEPSAGQGALIKALHRVDPRILVKCCELMDVNRVVLNKIGCTILVASDFLDLVNKEVNTPGGPNLYDRIIANPPFAKNQDIDHIYGMYTLLKPGGRMVSLASQHWVRCDRKKESGFRLWLRDHNAQIEDVPQGTFKASGTMIAAKVITIDKE